MLLLVAGSLVLLDRIDASQLPHGWHLEQNTNCVYSRLVNGPGKDSGDVHFLGAYSCTRTPGPLTQSQFQLAVYFLVVW